MSRGEISLVVVKKLSATELSNLDMAVGFDRWIPTEDAKGRAELKQKLENFLTGEKEVWVAIEDNIIVGFGVVAEFEGLPGGRTLESLEVTESFRRRGIGSGLMSEILRGYGETIVALMPLPELGCEKELEEFYKRHGFRSFSEDLMVRFPSDPEKLKWWITYMDNLLDSYKTLRRKMAEELPSKAGLNTE